MRKHNWQLLLGVCLLALSVFFYCVHYLVFRDSHHIFIYLFGDIAFVFIEVLLVTLIIHQVLDAREKSARLVKLNMVIGAFFSEVGGVLLGTLSAHDPVIRGKGCVETNEGAARKLERIRACFDKHGYNIETEDLDWNDLKSFVVAKRNFMLRLLENPNLLEHESFTDMLWAVFHLTEELDARESLKGIPGSDLRHLAGDAQRAYERLAYQWLEYMDHLRESYPYLFSLAIRTNPFDPNASAVVQE